jgi:hypothetical protein
MAGVSAACSGVRLDAGVRAGRAGALGTMRSRTRWRCGRRQSCGCLPLIHDLADVVEDLAVVALGGEFPAAHAGGVDGCPPVVTVPIDCQQRTVDRETVGSVDSFLLGTIFTEAVSGRALTCSFIAITGDVYSQVTQGLQDEAAARVAAVVDGDA